jgi:hypothetical protein
MKEITSEEACKILFIPWYLRILGFHCDIKIQVTKEPVQHGDYWSYPVIARYIYLKWLWFKYKILKIRNYE